MKAALVVLFASGSSELDSVLVVLSIDLGLQR